MSEGSLQPERRSTGVTAKAFFKGKSHQVVSQTADTGQGQSHTSTMGPPPPAKLATAKASPPPSKAAQGQDVAGSSTQFSCQQLQQQQQQQQGSRRSSHLGLLPSQRLRPRPGTCYFQVMVTMMMGKPKPGSRKSSLSTRCRCCKRQGQSCPRRCSTTRQLKQYPRRRGPQSQSRRRPPASQSRRPPA